MVRGVSFPSDVENEEGLCPPKQILGVLTMEMVHSGISFGMDGLNTKVRTVLKIEIRGLGPHVPTSL